MSTGEAKLARLLWLSVAAAVVTIALKTGAWLVTGSVGLLSDAAESLVNLVAAIVALATLHWASQPPDPDHRYGHEKAEYFSAGLEGGMILVAALSIAGLALSPCSTPPRCRTSAPGSRSRPQRPRSTWSWRSSSCGPGAGTTRSSSRPTGAI